MKYTYAIIFLMVLSFSLQAQTTDDGKRKERKERKERIQSKIESQKVAFITQKLELTPNEAQNFWPVYNEFQSKLKEHRELNRMDMKYEDINDAEANAFLDHLFKKEQEELEIKKRYYDKLKMAIPTRKVAQLYIIEKKFREEILSSIRNRMGKKRRKAQKGKF